MQKLKKNAVFCFSDNGWASLCNVATPSVFLSRHFFFICLDHIVCLHLLIECFTHSISSGLFCAVVSFLIVIDVIHNQMTFNTRSLVDINRRTKFSNTLNTHDYDTLCLTETWLTCDIPSAALFLNRYQVYRKDRMTDDDRKTWWSTNCNQKRHSSRTYLITK